MVPNRNCAGAFLELLSAWAKAYPMVLDCIVEMCQKKIIMVFQKYNCSRAGYGIKFVTVNGPYETNKNK